jgi:hypothetical protein
LNKSLPSLYNLCSMKKMLIVLLIFISADVLAQTWVAVGAAGMSGGRVFTPAIAVDSHNTPYMVYVDDADSQKATVKKFDGSSWVNVGTRGFSASAVEYTSIAIDMAGTPYVLYPDDSFGSKATVMKYNGSSWVTVGSLGFSAGPIDHPSIAIDRSGTPYVAYHDVGGFATVMKYNGSSWVVVGASGFSGAYVLYTSIAIDAGGTPYVVYQDWNSSYRATVMKFNGSSWVTVGSAGFSAGEADNTSIAIDGHGTPYVAYSDGGYNGPATVMKYNGSSWVTIGSPGFSAAGANFTSIAIDAGGTPYVAYQDWNAHLKATVMKYNGSSWVTVGSPGFSAGDVNFVSIAIDAAGTPYVGYWDLAPSDEPATVMKLDTALSPITGVDTICVGTTTTLIELKSGGVWSSSNSAIASIDATGVVSGLGTGQVTISYTKSGYSATYPMVIDSMPVAGTIIAPDSLCPGRITHLYNSVPGGIWSNMDTSLATVTSAGLLTGVAPGLVNLVYTITNPCGTDAAVYSFLIGSCPTEVNNLGIHFANSIVTYPNPAYNELTISASDKINAVAIYSLIGQTVYSHEYNSDKVQIDITALPAGVYLVRINGTEIRKFVKQ